jgi:alpha-tubulin suppressor-like RCC1 family protein
MRGLDDKCIASAALGSEHTLLLTTNGTILACGSNGSSQLGMPKLGDELVARQVMALAGKPASAIAAGYTHSGAIVSEGAEVYFWGSNQSGQCGALAEDNVLRRYTRIIYDFVTVYYVFVMFCFV